MLTFFYKHIQSKQEVNMCHAIILKSKETTETIILTLYEEAPELNNCNLLEKRNLKFYSIYSAIIQGQLGYFQIIALQHYHISFLKNRVEYSKQSFDL